MAETNVPEVPDNLAIAIAYLDKLFIVPEPPPLPPSLENDNEFYQVVKKILEIRKILSEFAEGSTTSPVLLKGFIGGSLKALQSNLRHLAWQMQKIGAGDFSQRVDFMGDFACSFNKMLATFEDAYGEVKRREEKMTELADNLRQEVKRRVDIEEQLRKSEEKYRLLATVDFLTGVYNRRHFYALADREMDRMGRNRRGMCLAMADIDFFKSVNDTYGHSAGDVVLTCIAETLVTNLRKVDIVARYGGEEFVILLPETPFGAGQATLERLREFISCMPITADDTTIKVTLSLGMTYISPDEVPPQDRRNYLELAMERADTALYRAKKNGRNRLECDMESFDEIEDESEKSSG